MVLFAMGRIFFVAIYLALPASTVYLLFLKDNSSKRRLLLSAGLLANTAMYFVPLAYAYFGTPAGGNMWNENGAGAALWLYMYVFPLSAGIQVFLAGRKDRAHIEYRMTAK
jgi:hypothetical protein